MEDITSEVVDQLTASCSDCDITSDIVNKQSFACFPESPTHVTYRARLEGTSKTDSGSLISLIEDWVRGRPSIVVTGVLMTVDSKCSVAISSLSEGECDTTTSSTSSSNNTAIIGGIVAVVIVLIVAIAVTVVIIVALVLKTRRGDLSIKKAE